MVDGSVKSDKESASSLWGGRELCVGFIALFWSLFQLATAHWILVQSVALRSVHLACALSLVYLSFPLRKGGRKGNVLDFFLAGVSGAAALYLIGDHVGIQERQGLPTPRDIFVGVTLLLLLLEGTRRALGPALPIIAICLMGAGLFASSLPGLLAFRSVSLSHLVSKLTLSTEGVYGIPLRVSSDTVFLFVLFGAFLEKAGGGQYFVDLAYSLLGGLKGGPAKAAVLASGLTGMVSGSSIANTVTTGTFTIPLMIRNGYPPTKAAAIEVAASTNGQLMPPIMGAAAFIIAEYCQLPYMEVVKAAFLPALISYLILVFITHLEASKLGLQGAEKEQRPPFLLTFLSGLHFLLPLGFLGYELIVERHSAHFAAYRAILALVGVMVARQGLFIMLKQKTPLQGVSAAARLIVEGLIKGACNMMAIGVAVACAGIVVGVISLGLGGKVTEIIGALSGGNFFLLLVVTAVASMILGMGLPTTANYIVMASLTAPAMVELAQQMDMELPLLSAHLFCFYFGILADDTPPVGLAAYAASAIAKSPPLSTGLQGFAYDLRTALLPFIFIFYPPLLLIGVTSWLEGVGVFLCALMGMGALAACFQRYLLIPCKKGELFGLAIASVPLLRPDWFGGTWLALLLGGGILGAVIARQVRCPSR